MASKQNSGFIVIEVLISIFITFLAIVTIVSIYKQNINLNSKIEHYQNIYITVKSVVNLLDKTDIKTTTTTNFEKIRSLNLNGFKIDIFAKKVKELKNFVTDSENINLSGNFGKYTYTLYKIKIELKKNNINKIFKYYLTKVKK